MIYDGDKYFFIKDHLGSTRLVVKSTDATVAQRIDYTDLGKVTANTDETFQPYGFAGGVYDVNTKFVRFGARNYDPEVGRWTSKDPILFNGGDTNLYGYVFSDPVNLIDPSGQIVFLPGVIGGAIGGAAGFVGSYNAPGATLGSILRSTTIGAAAGALSAYGGIGLGALVGFGANVASQVADGKSLQCVDYGSAGVSAAAGALGTYVGGVAAGRFQIPFPVIGQPLSSIVNSGSRSSGIISNGVGGITGGAADIYGNQLYGY